MSYYIDQHLLALQREGYSPATIRDRRRCLRRLNDDLPHGWVPACPEQLRAWLSHAPWSPATRYTYTGHILEAYRWLQAERIIQQNPADGIRRPRVPRGTIRVASDDELAVALTAPAPLRLSVILARYAGLRRAEACGLDREHVTVERIFIARAKGGDAQTVPTHPGVWAAVYDLPPGPLIVDSHGIRYTPERLGLYALRWFRAHGLPRLGLHDFRRAFGTEIQRLHRDIRITQEALRHANVNTTMLYTQVSDGQLRAAVAGLRWASPSL